VALGGLRSAPGDVVRPVHGKSRVNRKTCSLQSRCQQARPWPRWFPVSQSHSRLWIRLAVTAVSPRSRRRPEPGTLHACLDSVLILGPAGADCAMGLPLFLPLTQVRGPYGPRGHGAGERDRTADLPFTRSTASCAKSPDCTDGMGYCTDDTRRAGIVRQDVPRTVPRGRRLTPDVRD